MSFLKNIFSIRGKEVGSEKLQRSSSTPSLRKDVSSGNYINKETIKKQSIKYDALKNNRVSSNGRRFSELTSLKADAISDLEIKQAIKLYQNDDLTGASQHLKIAAQRESQIGMFLYGIALRHGWGCEIDLKLAFYYLQKAAEMSVRGLENMDCETIYLDSTKKELSLTIYELGMCFQHGWGVMKNKTTAVYYFQMAADMGDIDAQLDLGYCYFAGDGVKKNLYTSAKYYRLAHAQGAATVGNSWIFKEKFNKAC